MNLAPATPHDPASEPCLQVLDAGFAHLKGTRHESRPGMVLTDEGPVGDRRYCLVDLARRRVLRSVQNPGLVRVRTAETPEGLRLEVPGRDAVHAPAPGTGEVVDCDYWGRTAAVELTDGPHSALLSDYLGTPVRMGLAPAGSVVYGAPISLVATASLEAMGERLGRPELVREHARFRPSLLIRTEEPFVEETWEGRVFALQGSAAPRADTPDGTARLRLGPPIPRCAVIDAHPLTGQRDVHLMKALAACRPRNERGEPHFGVNAWLETGPPGLRSGYCPAQAS